MLSKEDAAKRLGMAVREVVDVRPVEGGTIVVTHDGYWTIVTDAGELVFGMDAITARVGPADPGESDESPARPVDDGSGEFALMPAGSGVPSGTAAEVLAWVDDDRERAGQALAVERGRDKPRASLTGPLEKLLAAAGEDDEQTAG